MPCDTITTTGIELGKNIDPERLKEALSALNLSPVFSGQRLLFSGGFYDLQTKQVTLRGSAMAGTQELVDKFQANIKREYGVAVLKANAKRYGWQVKQTGEYKYQVIKSTY